MELTSGGLAARRSFFGLEPTRTVRAKTTEDRTLLELLDPVAEAHGYAIVRIRLMGGGVRRLQIMAEDPATGDFTVDQCAVLSRNFSQVLDAADPISGEYVLEVSSPGVDRPLTRLKDYQTYEGLEARVELDRLVEGRKRFKGQIAGVEDQNVGINLEGETEETAYVPFAWIAEAKLVLNDELMKRGAEQRAARLAQEQADGEEAAADAAEPDQDDQDQTDIEEEEA